jgi:hypothetical protein
MAWLQNFVVVSSIFYTNSSQKKTPTTDLQGRSLCNRKVGFMIPCLADNVRFEAFMVNKCAKVFLANQPCQCWVKKQSFRDLFCIHRHSQCGEWPYVTDIYIYIYIYTWVRMEANSVAIHRPLTYQHVAWPGVLAVNYGHFVFFLACFSLGILWIFLQVPLKDFTIFGTKLQSWNTTPIHTVYHIHIPSFQW